MHKLSRKTRRHLYWTGAVTRAIGGLVLLPILIMIVMSGGLAFIIMFIYAWVSLPALLLLFAGHYLAASNKSYAHRDPHFPE